MVMGHFYGIVCSLEVAYAWLGVVHVCVDVLCEGGGVNARIRRVMHVKYSLG